ncbi:MAG: glutamate formimidoyltransferase [Flavobacteriia bacterium]|nr:glutamate formimidoyltransferase [Flavobacteriia bacterium]
MSTPLIECVPNVSEGRDPMVISQIADAIRSVEDVQLLHVDSGAGANRTVFTFVGPPPAVTEAAFRMFEVCSKSIDMRNQTGTHPRQGAVDVCPFVPLHNITLEKTSEYAHQLGYRVGEELGIPGYFYEGSATKTDRRNLAVLRRGEYESLQSKSTNPEWEPDFGSYEGKQWKKSGASVIGARNFLIAYNVDLDTDNSDIAQRIAEVIRERGSTVFHEDGSQESVPGLLNGVKAIGWFIPEYGNAQVSTNIVDIRKASPGRVFAAVKREAEKLGVRVLGSELIGLIPQQVLVQSARDLGVPEPGDLPSMMNAVHVLKLDHRRAFDIEDRVIERIMKRK